MNLAINGLVCPSVKKSRPKMVDNVDFVVFKGDDDVDDDILDAIFKFDVKTSGSEVLAGSSLAYTLSKR